MHQGGSFVEIVIPGIGGAVRLAGNFQDPTPEARRRAPLAQSLDQARWPKVLVDVADHAGPTSLNRFMNRFMNRFSEPLQTRFVKPVFVASVCRCPVRSPGTLYT
jgi:hypothetical protein